MKKGTRIYVRWLDITAITHSDEELNPVVAESVGWIIRDTKKVLEMCSCRYMDGCDHKDRIAIPKGVIEKMEVI